MNIGYYTSHYPGLAGEGGIGTYTRLLAQGLSLLGHNVHVVVPAPRRETVLDESIHVHLTPCKHFPIIDRLAPGEGACYHVGRELRRVARENQLDVVEFTNWEGRGTWYSLNRPTPYLVRLSTSSLESAQIDGVASDYESKWQTFRETWFSRRADALVTHSNAHRIKIAQELGVDASRIEISPPGIVTYPNFVRPDRGDKPPTVVFLGRLEHRKGTLDLLHAIPATLQAVENVRFIFIGKDRAHCPGGRTHEQYVMEEFPSSIRDRIEFAGSLPNDQVDLALQEADLFVAPSLYESFGYIFVEAMRWGTPSIGTRAGGIPEIIQDDVTGVLVDPGQPEQIAQAMIQLLQNDERRLRIGEAGRRHVEGKFDWSQMAKRAEDLYTRTMGVKS